MKTIGFRCWENRVACIVLDGIVANPSIIASRYVKAPPNSSRSRELEWFRKEVIEVATTHKVGTAFFREVEGKVRNASVVHRYEFHGVLQEAWHSVSPDVPLQGRVANQIKKALKYQGAAADLPKEFIAGTVLEELAQTNFKDAILVALCGLA